MTELAIRSEPPSHRVYLGARQPAPKRASWMGDSVDEPDVVASHEEPVQAVFSKEAQLWAKTMDVVGLFPLRHSVGHGWYKEALKPVETSLASKLWSFLVADSPPSQVTKQTMFDFLEGPGRPTVQHVAPDARILATLSQMERAVANMERAIGSQPFSSIDEALAVLSRLDSLVDSVENAARSLMARKARPVPPASATVWSSTIEDLGSSGPKDEEIVRDIGRVETAASLVCEVSGHRESQGRIAVRFDVPSGWTQVNFDASPLPWPAIKAKVMSFERANKRLETKAFRSGPDLASFLKSIQSK